MGPRHVDTPCRLFKQQCRSKSPSVYICICSNIEHTPCSTIPQLRRRQPRSIQLGPAYRQTRHPSQNVKVSPTVHMQLHPVHRDALHPRLPCALRRAVCGRVCHVAHGHHVEAALEGGAIAMPPRVDDACWAITSQVGRYFLFHPLVFYIGARIMSLCRNASELRTAVDVQGHADPFGSRKPAKYDEPPQAGGVTERPWSGWQVRPPSRPFMHATGWASNGSSTSWTSARGRERQRGHWHWYKSRRPVS